jgi:hypothetical protein
LEKPKFRFILDDAIEEPQFLPHPLDSYLTEILDHVDHNYPFGGSK